MEASCVTTYWSLHQPPTLDRTGYKRDLVRARAECALSLWISIKTSEKEEIHMTDKQQPKRMTLLEDKVGVVDNMQYGIQPDIKFGPPLLEQGATRIPASAMETDTELTIEKLLETFRLCKEREWMMEGELLPTHTLTRRSKTLFTPWIVTKDNNVHGPSMGFEWVVNPITDDPMASATQVRFCGPMGLRMANEYAAWRMSMEPIMWQWAAPEESDTKHYTFTAGSIEWRVHVNNSDDSATACPIVDVYAGNVLCIAMEHWPASWARPTPKSDPQMAIESLLRYLS